MRFHFIGNFTLFRDRNVDDVSNNIDSVTYRYSDRYFCLTEAAERQCILRIFIDICMITSPKLVKQWPGNTASRANDHQAERLNDQPDITFT